MSPLGHAISRRGHLPHLQGEFPGIEELMRRNSQPVPILVQEHGQPRTVAEVLTWVRADAAAAAEQGEAWHEATDAVRDAAKHIWPRLPLAERRPSTSGSIPRTERPTARRW